MAYDEHLAVHVMLQDKDPEKTNRVIKSVLNMKNLDMARLQQAYERA